MSFLSWLLSEKPKEPKQPPVVEISQSQKNEISRKGAEDYCKKWILSNSDKYQIVATMVSGKVVYSEPFVSEATTYMHSPHLHWETQRVEHWYPQTITGKQKAENFLNHAERYSFIKLDGKSYNTKNIESIEIVKIKE